MTTDLKQEKTGTRYVDIVFLQNHEDADPALEILHRDGVNAAAAYLAQWDHHEPADQFNSSYTPLAGHGDYAEATSDASYIVTWNDRFGYIGLERVA